MRLARLLALTALACLGLALGAGAATARTTDTEVLAGLEELVAAPEGPPGAIATLYRDGRLTTLGAGLADAKKHLRPPSATDHMRIASVAKAFSGAVALNLVRAGKLGLGSTIGAVLPSLPEAWSGVTLRQLLNHTSGVPDYTKSNGFAKQANTNPHGFVSPSKIIGWVDRDPLVFRPGAHYEYSNTDNIVVGLMVEAVTGRTYAQELQRIVFGPARLTQTTLPTNIVIPRPFIHGYTDDHGRLTDVSHALSPSGAWASGGIVSTPRDLNAFIRADLGLRFFGRAQRRGQMRWWVGGESSPPGPGKNSAGLALFRYQTRCGTVYGHTGNFPGYTQFAAATADGTRAVTMTLNIPAPTGKLLGRLRQVQTAAVCDLLGR